MSVNLISFGCSHTWGSCMPDIYDADDMHLQKRHNGDAYPSKYAWGNIVARKLHLKHNNQAVPGASNRHILYKILNYDYGQDVVCILWSHTNRHTLFVDHETYSHWGPWAVDESKAARAWYKYCYQSYDSVLDTAQCISHAMLHLDSKNIPNYHMLQTSTGSNFFKDFPRKHIKYILDCKIQNVFFDNYRRITPLAFDNKHAGQRAHAEFGKAVAESITKNNVLNIGEIL